MIEIKTNFNVDDDTEVDIGWIGENITKHKLVMKQMRIDNNIIQTNEKATYLFSQFTESNEKNSRL